MDPHVTGALDANGPSGRAVLVVGIVGVLEGHGLLADVAQHGVLHAHGSNISHEEC
jgi:hypothetical protein